MVLAGQAVTGVSAQSVGQLRIGDNVRLGSDPRAARGGDVPGLAVNPSDSRHIVAVELDIVDGRCVHRVTFDGAATWAEGSLKAPAGFPSPPCPTEPFAVANSANNVLDATVAFGTGLNVYTAFSVRRGTEGESVLLAKSTDGGRTYSTASVVIAGGPSFRTDDRYQLAKLAVEARPEGDRVYIATFQVRSTPALAQMAVVTSSDGGATWGQPVAASAPSETANREFSPPVVGPSGAVFVAWRTIDPTGSPNHYLVVGRSNDGGATWTRTRVLAVTVTNPAIPAGTYPKLAVDRRTGRLYLAYQESAPGARQDHFLQADSEIWLVRSIDEGSTWSPPVRVNDDPGGNVQQRLPRVSVAQDGRVDMVWHDRRHAYRAPRDVHAGLSSPAWETRTTPTRPMVA